MVYPYFYKLIDIKVLIAMDKNSNLVKLFNDLLIFLFSVALVFSLLMMFVPIDVYLNNIRDLHIKPGVIIITAIKSVTLISAMTLAFYVVILLLAGRIKLFERLNVFLLGVVSVSVVFFWINVNFFSRDAYGVLDGRGDLVIDRFGTISIAQAICFLLLIALFILIRKKRYIVRNMLFVLLLTSGITMVFQYFQVKQSNIVKTTSNDKAVVESDMEFTQATKPFFTFSSNNKNILFILLDEYQREFFQHMIENNENIKSQLDGFLFYEDAVSNYPYTIASVMTMFSGEIYENKHPIWDKYEELKAKRATVPLILHDHGVHVSHFDAYDYTKALFPDSANFSPENFGYEVRSDYRLSLNIALFKMLPEVLKPNKIDYYDDIIKVITGDEEDFSNEMVKAEELKIIEFIKNADIVVEPGAPTFKYYHSELTHSPTLFTPSCEIDAKRYLRNSEQGLVKAAEESVCVLNIFLEGFVNKLRQLQVFDNTMIVFVADHGSQYSPAQFNGTQFPYSKSAATLLIKPFNSAGALTVIDYPAEVLDMAATILPAYDIQFNGNGVNLLSENKPAVRNRTFFNYSNTKDRVTEEGLLPAFTHYSINGVSSVPASWSQN